MRATAVAEGFDVVAWWTPVLPAREWQEAVARAGWPAPEISGVRAVPTECVAWVGQPNHYPYSVVISGGSAHPWPIWGVLPDPAWAASLQLRRSVHEFQGKGIGR
jgi:hypothetical protein